LERAIDRNEAYEAFSVASESITTDPIGQFFQEFVFSFHPHHLAINIGQLLPILRRRPEGDKAFTR
jgi:hypothetical protein